MQKGQSLFREDRLSFSYTFRQYIREFISAANNNSHLDGLSIPFVAH